MTQRRSQALRQTLAVLTSFSVLVSSMPVRAQFSKENLAKPAAVASQGSNQGGALGSPLLDSGTSGMALGAPLIRQDDRIQIQTAPAASTQNNNPPVVIFKPLPANDFQTFVRESIGKNLNLFGADFFTQPTGATFAPLANTPVSTDYRMGPGDEVQIKGWGAVDIDVRTAIDRDGLIHIPRVGAVTLAGVKSSQAEATIRAAVGRYFKDFQLSVTMGQLRGITIYVVGQARQPGAYSVSGASTLVSALFVSGGPNNLGSMRHIQVKRGDRIVTELDLYDFIAKGDKSADVKLQDGDTIMIPPAKGYVALAGKVATPAVYELSSEQETIGSVLALAGGLPVVADPKRAYLERLDPTQKPSRSVETFALDATGLRKKLKNGDVLSVLSLSSEFSNAITLRGNVDQPVRTTWRPGMKVQDLIPSKSFLMSRASVARQNSVLQRSDENEESLASHIGDLVDEVNLEYAVIERVDSADVSVRLIPFNLGQALADVNSPENMPLQPGDIVTVFSVNDVRIPQAKRQVFVRVEGEVQRPGIYQMTPGDGLKQLVNKAGGLTQDAYLFGAGFFREEVRLTQERNLQQVMRRLESQIQTRLSTVAASISTVSSDSASLGQARLEAETQAQQQALDRVRAVKPTGRIMLGLASDAKPDALPTLRLENNDRLVIPPKPDFVHVLGSVNTESSLLWRAGRPVQYYLDQSGLTSGADTKEMFIMRADGSVLSSTSGWSSSVASATVLPGDLIVLPEKTDHESAWSVFTRNAKDITQIIYQFSLGAAAIKTLRD